MAENIDPESLYFCQHTEEGYDNIPDEGGSSGSGSSGHEGVAEEDMYIPIVNISRIMKRVFPANAKITKDAKDAVQECVTEFIGFITSESSDKCLRDKRKVLTGDDVIWALGTLGFDDYVQPLKTYLQRFQEVTAGSEAGVMQGTGGIASSSSTKESNSSLMLDTPRVQGQA